MRADLSLTENRKNQFFPIKKDVVSMYYSEELIEEVRLKNDIVDVISGYVKLQKKGSSYFGLCP